MTDRQLSLFEKTFFATQPFREYLQKQLRLRDFLRLLQTSWTVYASFRRKGPVLQVPCLQLSDLFVTHCLCNPHTQWEEFAAFVRSALQLHPLRGLTLELRNRCSTTIAQPFVSINVQPWLWASVKLYKTIYEPCCESRNTNDTLLAGKLEHERIDTVVEWIKKALIELRVFTSSDRTTFSNYEVNKFVFWHRIARHHDTHRDWFTKNSIDTMQLYQNYMESVGLDSTPHEMLKSR